MPRYPFRPTSIVVIPNIRFGSYASPHPSSSQEAATDLIIVVDIEVSKGVATWLEVFGSGLRCIQTIPFTNRSDHTLEKKTERSITGPF